MSRFDVVWITDSIKTLVANNRLIGRSILTVLMIPLLSLPAQLSARKPVELKDYPVIDLQEYEVIYNRTNFRPNFRYKSPQFSYFDIPELPKGELILALDFIDRYRLADIPGSKKWAGLLTFPMFDGDEIPSIKWLCLYMYDDVMYGYDPEPPTAQDPRFNPMMYSGAVVRLDDLEMRAEMNRRFVVPIRFEDRMNPSILYRFAESYVESVSPRQDRFVYFRDMDGYDDNWRRSDGMFSYTRSAGRIAPILDSQRDKEPRELVRLVYQFYQEPNPGQAAESNMGPDDAFLKRDWSFAWNVSWETINKELGGFTVHDEIELARQLVAPRWSQKVTFYYKKDFLFWNLKNTSSILLFNIGNRLFAYSPRYGVWKTDGLAAHLDDLEFLGTKLKYPGIEYVDRIEFIPN